MFWPILILLTTVASFFACSIRLRERVTKADTEWKGHDGGINWRTSMGSKFIAWESKRLVAAGISLRFLSEGGRPETGEKHTHPYKLREEPSAVF